MGAELFEVSEFGLPAAPPRREKAGSTSFRVWLAIIAISIFYMMLGHDLGRSLLFEEGFNIDAAEMQERAEEGMLRYRAGFVGIGLVGLWLLMSPGGPRFGVHSALGVLILLTAAWCFASVAWSADTMLTVRRLVTLTCSFVGALGVARMFRAREICLLAFVFTICMVIFGLAAELALGTFRPWNSEYRLAGFVHPNTMAIELTVLAISSYLLGAAYPRRRGLLYAIVACCVVLVVLTRSRTGAACFLVGFAAIWLLHTSLKTKFYSITIAIMIGSAILAALFMVGIDDPESFSNMLLLGRADDPTSFTGRLPIWQTLMDEVRQRPLAGYGWHSYWSDETLDYMADQHEWAIPNAHNGYIEIILGVGYVGMLLLALTMIAGMWEIGRVKSRDRFYALTFALISLGWLHAMLESHMLENFNFAPFLVAAGLLRLAFFEAPPKLAEPPETTLSQEHELALSAYQP